MKLWIPLLVVLLSLGTALLRPAAAQTVDPVWPAAWQGMWTGPDEGPLAPPRSGPFCEGRLAGPAVLYVLEPTVHLELGLAIVGVDLDPDHWLYEGTITDTSFDLHFGYDGLPLAEILVTGSLVGDAAELSVTMIVDQDPLDPCDGDDCTVCWSFDCCWGLDGCGLGDAPALARRTLVTYEMSPLFTRTALDTPDCLAIREQASTWSSLKATFD